MAARMLLALLVGAALVTAQQPSRSITFKNACPRDVWVVGTAGATGSCADGCQEGSTCNEKEGTCYFKVPAPDNGYRIKVGGKTKFTFPAWNNKNDAAWSGNFNACLQGTLCAANGKVADKATCDAQGCASFHIGTAAEITMLKRSVDTYDVSNIGGIAVPMSFEPTKPHKKDGDPYFCANLGALKSKTGLGSNPWKFDVPDKKYKWVIAGSDAPGCSSDNDCDNATCGLALDKDDQVTFRVKCGRHAGYWTQNAICTANPDTDVMPCLKHVQNGPFDTNVWELQGCTGDAVSGSCYQPNPDANCCGCANWQDILGSSNVPDMTPRCENKNPVWGKNVRPTIEWLKRGAPGVYTYPYDDVSSTSTCDNMQGEWNTQNYIVELCPGGVYWDGSRASAEPEGPAPDQQMTFIMHE